MAEPDLVGFERLRILLDGLAGREHSPGGRVAAALAVVLREHLAILAEAGRLLPQEASSDVIEWGVSWYGGDPGGRLMVRPRLYTRGARAMWRVVRQWPDGTTLTGPWMEAEDER